jgi:antitoxin YefM
MSITASEARKELFPLIKKVNEDHDAIEIVSRHGSRPTARCSRGSTS